MTIAAGALAEPIPVEITGSDWREAEAACPCAAECGCLSLHYVYRFDRGLIPVGHTLVKDRQGNRLCFNGCGLVMEGEARRRTKPRPTKRAGLYGAWRFSRKAFHIHRALRGTPDVCLLIAAPPGVERQAVRLARTTFATFPDLRSLRWSYPKGERPPGFNGRANCVRYDAIVAAAALLAYPGRSQGAQDVICRALGLHPPELARALEAVRKADLGPDTAAFGSEIHDWGATATTDGTLEPSSGVGSSS